MQQRQQETICETVDAVHALNTHALVYKENRRSERCRSLRCLVD